MVTTRLLISVRSLPEALDALTGGAELIDIKEPNRGSLGRADTATLEAIAAGLAGRCPVSAALGELVDYPGDRIDVPLSYVKCGLSSCGEGPDWPRRLGIFIRTMRATQPQARPVAVAYADWQRAGAPLPQAVLAAGHRLGCGAFLIDTWQKDGLRLLDWICLADLSALRHEARDRAMEFAVAGSLREEDLPAILPLQPDWIAVRGAACDYGREGRINPEKVRKLAELVRGCPV